MVNEYPGKEKKWKERLVDYKILDQIVFAEKNGALAVEMILIIFLERDSLCNSL